jgi:hypothetical protein
MKNKKKAKSSIPRHQRLDRVSRLQAAKHWIPKYEGSNLLRGYKQHFGVDWECAIRELEMLGIQLNPQYTLQVRHSIEAQLRSKHAKKQAKQRETIEHGISDSDYHFCFIAGYTENGTPYGVTWEEWEEME